MAFLLASNAGPTRSGSGYGRTKEIGIKQNVAMVNEGGGTVAHRSDFYKISLLGRRLGGVARPT